MDNTKEFTTLEWFAGYAGNQLGLRRAIPNLRTVAYCEREIFACANLVAKMEAELLDVAPIWSDVKTFPVEEFHGKVDCLIASYPCQPFSAAGKRQGADDPRHLWPYVINAVRVIQPRYCFFENVEGHISLGLSTVISDLEEAGYRTTWGIFSAEEVGAPHRRKRVFILAERLGDTSSIRLCEPGADTREATADTDREERWVHESEGASALPGHEPQQKELADSLRFRSEAGFSGQEQREEGVTGVANNSGYQDAWPSRPGQPQHEWEPPRVVANPTGSSNRGKLRDLSETDESLKRPKEQHENKVRELESANGESGTNSRVLRDERGDGGNRRQTQSPLGGNSDGSTDRVGNAKLYESCDNRTDELRLLGNGVVPATVELAWKTLYRRLK